ncbi:MULTISPECIES: MBL fold metallo-hydrolase [Streptomyces]|uniref:L-ascorbate metabolism protein UlaG, beta-lactamase superfamily n=2 Tax=Streptomyces griseoaurantiacus TaxID=68213 RepID=A0A1G7NFF8_9ACTN|nr:MULTISPECIES: MBL fold metallo-hydrolase [Streptomyces]MBA5225810.1 MBL fold metallo-hydrolase [Streptomyces griseoaurantiacus]MDX3087441.1 MBL fold metallo-hydrolase [Streptomyces sp. ME12-02E]MDX3330796.1 MBL fold metallo-hydrolase [Streptomyces sp. ME02-6978a]MDX3359849.1 MBL fold metallo-hydrolase [Streptomyces sp. ME02-6978.2a]SDF72651.1 L-ascorbate metabolism protein UlaG, beta-lactamase superfamily [Streptomyces jietaisiensis]
MHFTKYAHACVALEKDGTRLVVDPGTFTPEAAEAVDRADAVLITHGHFDHFDEKLVAAALAARPELLVHAPADVVGAFGSHGGRVRAVTAGDTFTVGSFTVSVHGHRHAPIHEDIPRPDNVGYLVDEGVLYHPGDAYFVPDAPVRTLLLPTSGPWTKLGEAADFVRAVKPERIVQIHELMLSDLGQQSAANLLGEQGLTGLALERPAPGTTIEL